MLFQIFECTFFNAFNLQPSQFIIIYFFFLLILIYLKSEIFFNLKKIWGNMKKMQKYLILGYFLYDLKPKNI